MEDDIVKSAHIGYLITQELIRRNQAGRIASARSLEKTLLSLIDGSSNHVSFRRFIAEKEDEPGEEN